MLAYKEIISLRDQLLSGEITVQYAMTKYWKDFKEGQRSWNTKDWKERRASHIKKQCELCGSNEALTIQHRSHPEKYANILRDINRTHAQAYITTNPVIEQSTLLNYIEQKYDYTPVAFCPNCKYSNPNKRVRKTPVYRCLTCKHEFDDPVYKTIDQLVAIFIADEFALEVRDKCLVSKDKWRNHHNLPSAKYWLQRETIITNNTATLEKEAFLIYLNDCIKYLSFEDAITACKKCAFNFDIRRSELCPQCKVNYKGIQYTSCLQCLPEDKRKAALEKIEFGKGWQAMHEELGID